MQHEGPQLEPLLRHLAETPQDFLDAPIVKQVGMVNVAALVFDSAQQLGIQLSGPQLNPFISGDIKQANWLKLCAIACWFVHHEFFAGKIVEASWLNFLTATIRSLANEYSAEKYLTDPERREEFVRIALADFEHRPAGETLAQAQDRLQALSSTERKRILQAARAAEERARQIREALLQKQAAEAADKYTRE